MTDWSSTWTEGSRVVRPGVVRGALTPPPSKSWTQRHLNLVVLSGRRCRLHRPLEAEDTWTFAAALETLGWRVERSPGLWELAPPLQPGTAGQIDCRASGTLYRFLVATLALLPGDWVVDGSPRLRQRPIAPLVDALRELGAQIGYLGRQGEAPLHIGGGSLAGGRCRLDARDSSQFLSALLMAGAATQQGIAVDLVGLTSRPYVELTARALERFGGRVEWSGPQSVAAPSATLGAAEADVESDASAACYPAAAAALTGGRVLIRDLAPDGGQGDLRFLDLLARMGAAVRWLPEGVEVAGGEPLMALEADLAAMPDQAPTLAALAPFARGSTAMRGVAHLRHKESDRLAAMTHELRRLGASVRETADGLIVEGSWSRRAPSRRVEVDTHDDHRIAMSLALVGLRRPGVVIRSPQVVAKSYPAFWQDLEALLA